MIQKGKINIVIDGQWGSTGKGKLYGYLYNRYPYINVSVCDFMPNAAHTYIDGYGKKFVSKIMPIGSLFPQVKFVCIGPHAVFKESQLLKEYAEVLKWRDSDFELAIHPLATVIDDADLDNERSALTHISSTLQGGCSSVVRKMMRNSKNCNLAKNCKSLGRYIRNTQRLVQHQIGEEDTILCETAQGFDLGLNIGQYPYTTSRDCLIGRLLDNAGGHPKSLGSIIASLRSFPIRVGNTSKGYSGPYYSDQREISWDDISKYVGHRVEEKTTITNKVRRIFTWSNCQTVKFLDYCRPDFAFLNFVNYYPDDYCDREISRIKKMLSAWNCKLSLLGTGSRNNDMIELDRRRYY